MDLFELAAAVIDPKQRKRKPLPSQSLLRECFDYDPETDVFVWKKIHYSQVRYLGKPAGTMKANGYVFMNVPGFGLHGAHRLAWIYMYGLTIGGFEVDHIDGNSINNAIGNLRLATSSQQKFNSRVRSTNRSGLKGAYYHSCRVGKKWRSQIRVNARQVFLGYFATAEEAHEAYCAAATKYHGEFARVA